jgi:isopentenyldiphosphate isomerase
MADMPFACVITPNPEEFDHYKWMNLEEWIQDLGQNPLSYSPWLPPVLQAVHGM